MGRAERTDDGGPQRLLHGVVRSLDKQDSAAPEFLLAERSQDVAHRTRTGSDAVGTRQADIHGIVDLEPPGYSFAVR